MYLSRLTCAIIHRFSLSAAYLTLGLSIVIFVTLIPEGIIVTKTTTNCQQVNPFVLSHCYCKQYWLAACTRWLKGTVTFSLSYMGMVCGCTDVCCVQKHIYFDPKNMPVSLLVKTNFHFLSVRPIFALLPPPAFALFMSHHG